MSIDTRIPPGTIPAFPKVLTNIRSGISILIPFQPPHYTLNLSLLIIQPILLLIHLLEILLNLFQLNLLIFFNLQLVLLMNLLPLLKHNFLLSPFHQIKLINNKILKISLLLHPFPSLLSLSSQFFLLISRILTLLLGVSLYTIENLLLKLVDLTIGLTLHFRLDSSYLWLTVHVLKWDSVFSLNRQIVSSPGDLDDSGNESIRIKSVHKKMSLSSLSIVNCKFRQIVETYLKKFGDLLQVTNSIDDDKFGHFVIELFLGPFHLLNEIVLTFALFIKKQKDALDLGTGLAQSAHIVRIKLNFVWVRNLLVFGLLLVGLVLVLTDLGQALVNSFVTIRRSQLHGLNVRELSFFCFLRHEDKNAFWESKFKLRNFTGFSVVVIEIKLVFEFWLKSNQSESS
jgi:hypothetical protein